MKLLWKVQTDNQPRQMHNLFPPLIAGNVSTPAGDKEIAVLAGVSDNIYGIDVETGHPDLEAAVRQHVPGAAAAGRGGSVLCPGGLTATPVLEERTPGKYVAYAVSWDGRLRTLDVATGEEIEPPELFLPPNGKPYGLNLHNGVIYTTTAQGCGGNPNNFYSYDLATKKVGNYNPGSGGLWPRTGPSVGKDGTVYAGSGDGDYLPEQQIYGQAMIGVKQNPETKALELKDWYAPSNAVWMRKRDLDLNATGPIFDYKGKEYLVQSSKECRIWLLDTAMLGGEDHRTPVYRTPLVCNEEVNFTMGVWGALATWEDATRTRWVLTPFWGPKHPQFKAPIEHGQVVHGAIAAFTLEDRTGKPQLVPAWLSRDMPQADPAVIANGIVFGYGSGEKARRSAGRSRATSAARRDASRNRRTRCSMRSTARPARSCGRAAIRSRRGTTSAACRSRTAASTSGRSTASCTHSASIDRPARSDRRRHETNHRRRRSFGLCPHDGRLAPRAGSRVDHRGLRRTTHRLGADGCESDQGCRPEGNLPVPVEGEVRKRNPSAEFVDATDHPRSTDRIPRIQGTGVHRRQRRSRVCHRHRSCSSVLDDALELFRGDGRSASKLVGVSRRARSPRRRAARCWRRRRFQLAAEETEVAAVAARLANRAGARRSSVSSRPRAAAAVHRLDPRLRHLRVDAPLHRFRLAVSIRCTPSAATAFCTRSARRMART